MRLPRTRVASQQPRAAPAQTIDSVGARPNEKSIPLLPAASDPWGISWSNWGFTQSSRGLASRSSQCAEPSRGVAFPSRGIYPAERGAKSAEQGDYFPEQGDYLAEPGDHSNVHIFAANELDGRGRGEPYGPVMRISSCRCPLDKR